MSHTARRTLAGLAAVLLSCVAALAGLASPAQAAVTSQPSVESQLLSLTNSARASAGLSPLHSSATLQSIARSWSAHQASTGVMAHNPSLFSSVHGWSGMAENVAKAYSASQAQSLFMGSAGHRINILNSHYTLVGIGVSRDSSGALWFTVDFEQPSGSTPAPAPAPRPKPTAHPTTSSSSARHTVATRATRSSTRTAVTRPLVKKVVVTAVPAAPHLNGQLQRSSRATSGEAVYSVDQAIAVADLSASFASPSPVVATTTLVGFIASMVLAAAGLLLLGVTRTRRRS